MLRDLKTHEILDIFASGLTSDPPVDSGVSNPPVNGLVQVAYLVGSSVV